MSVIVSGSLWNNIINTMEHQLHITICRLRSITKRLGLHYFEVKYNQYVIILHNIMMVHVRMIRMIIHDI